MPDTRELAHIFRRFGHTEVKVLMVVDGNIDTVEAAGAFGIGRVARLINELHRGCSSFTAHTARREAHADAAENVGHISTSFRFDDRDGSNLVIDRYDELWLFGFRGEGAGPVVSSDELRALTDWMNRGGGLFATGDHEDLGASMCAGIPRLRAMRRWTEADGVPPVGTPKRLDTNRPASAAEATGSSPIDFSHERDAAAQAIQWVRVSSVRNGLRVITRPHEVLCHPTLGPIDVMPDHPHEGRTRSADEIDLTRTYDFGGGIAGEDFPASGTDRPVPMAIATGETFPAPPSSKPYKGPAELIEFPMITVYDGRSAGVRGRVATDSTWHHWFDLNLYGLEHAADTTAWRKVARYFENLAVWLAPPGRYRMKCSLLHEWFKYPLLEEVRPERIDPDKLPPELGRAVRGSFVQAFGPCTVTRFAWDSLCDLAPQACRGLERFKPFPPHKFPPVCLTCPPFERLEETILEGLMVGTIPFMRDYAERPEELSKLKGERLEKVLDAYLAVGLDRSLRTYGKRLVDDLQEDLQTWTRVLESKSVSAWPTREEAG